MKPALRPRHSRRSLLGLGARIAILTIANITGRVMTNANTDARAATGRIALPSPAFDGALTVEAALRARRSVREFAPAPITFEETGQILWAAQGITDPAGYRTAPSAGALYPLEVSLVAGNVESLQPGIYRYDPGAHALLAAGDGDRRHEVADAALSQRWIADAPAIAVVAAVLERTTGKYRGRGIRYVHIEAGHAAQNLYLQAASLGLGTTIVGAFDDSAIADVLGLDEAKTPICLMPVGRQ